ncbi:MAG: ABC transporter substrate-binding protein [Rhodospirillaceae bacterium]
MGTGMLDRRFAARIWDLITTVLSLSCLVVGLILGTIAVAQADEPPTLRLALLKFGTVNWEQNVIAHHQLAKDVKIEIIPLANPQAGKIALLGGSADAIVSDWLWVSRQRQDGHAIGFAPYSKSVGALLVPEDSAIQTLADLKGKTVGVVGGPLDKSWLVLSALALETEGLDLATETEVISGAPPLLNKQMEAGELDAIVTYWHFAARLKAKGFRAVVSVPEAMTELGIGAAVPALGYVFTDAWAAAHPDALAGFLRASQQAKAILGSSDAEWERLRDLTKAKSDAELIALRDGFREGIPQGFGAAEQDAAAKFFAFLADLGGPQLVGPGDGLATGTFLPATDG